MIALLLACQHDGTDSTPKDSPPIDTGVDSVDSAPDTETAADSESGGDTDTSVDSDTGTNHTGETDTNDSPTPDTCGTTFDTDIEYEAAEPCDPSLPWVDVSAGVLHTCAVKSDGCGQCWGASMDEPGYEVPAEAFQLIRTTQELDTWDEFHICGLTVDGRPVCWGGPNHYRENDVPSGHYVGLSCGTTIANAIRDDGAVREWGYLDGCAEGPYAEVATVQTSSVAVLSDGTLELGNIALGTYAVADGIWHGIAHGDSRVCGIRSDRDDSVECVDIMDATEVTIPDLPTGPMLAVCVAEDEGCALDLAGAPSCWSEAPPFGSIQDPPPGPFVQITCGFDHACALTAEGSIECWGTDYAGETVVPS